MKYIPGVHGNKNKRRRRRKKVAAYKWPPPLSKQEIAEDSKDVFYVTCLGDKPRYRTFRQNVKRSTNIQLLPYNKIGKRK